MDVDGNSSDDDDGRGGRSSSSFFLANSPHPTLDGVDDERGRNNGGAMNGGTRGGGNGLNIPSKRPYYPSDDEFINAAFSRDGGVARGDENDDGAKKINVKREEDDQFGVDPNKVSAT